MRVLVDLGEEEELLHLDPQRSDVWCDVRDDRRQQSVLERPALHRIAFCHGPREPAGLFHNGGTTVKGVNAPLSTFVMEKGHKLYTRIKDSAAEAPSPNAWPSTSKSGDVRDLHPKERVHGIDVMPVMPEHRHLEARISTRGLNVARGSSLASAVARRAGKIIMRSVAAVTCGAAPELGVLKRNVPLEPVSRQAPTSTSSIAATAMAGRNRRHELRDDQTTPRYCPK
jgi:hypothetical protein